MKEPKVSIRVPVAFFAERNYLCHVIFTEFIGLQYELIRDEQLTEHYIIDTDDGRIIFNDDFFSRTNEADGYLSEALIPSQVDVVNDGFIDGPDIHLLYGTGGISVEPGRILCGHDIFASVFFMLTRWEEAVLKETDYLERFPAKNALAVKYDFVHRPVVNEWIIMLQNMLRHLDPSIQFSPQQQFRINFTHDIDFLNAPVSAREFAKDILRRKSFAALSKRFGYLVNGKNPLDLFSYFMDVSERNNTISRFYFMTGHNVAGRDGESYNSTPLYKSVLKKIKERGHVIGFHPSLLSYNDPRMFAKEKKILENDLDQEVTEGRQHALRFKMPDTWNMWNNNGMTLDSTLGYSAREGFRCGTGNTFTTFDVVQRKTLTLKEMPLVVMDTTLHVNRKLGLEKSAAIIRNYVETGKKYGMPVTFLFHNSIDEQIDWKNWKTLYDELFNR